MEDTGQTNQNSAEEAIQQEATQEQTKAQEAPSQGPSWRFVSEEEVARSAEPVNTQPPIGDNSGESSGGSEYIATLGATEEGKEEDFDLDSNILDYLSEKLGREINTYDDLTIQQQNELDERVSSIANFVEETGRSPEDWFIYQRLNPSEMDDLTSVKVQMSVNYPNLTESEINTLVSNKYKLDEDMYSEEDVTMSKLQLKLDSEEARKSIEDLRNKYKAPERTEESYEPWIDENWISEMRAELDALEGIEFELPNGKSFTFGIDQGYKNSLAERNENLDQYFDRYVDDSGHWDYDKMNMHSAVVDNIETIVKSVYQQGLSDGQRNVVQSASNMSSQSPRRSGHQPSPLSEQLRQALGGSDKITFNL